MVRHTTSIPASWLTFSLFYLLVIALSGTWLRALGFIPADINYKNLLHAHSHLAFLGWVYNVLYALLISYFIRPGNPRMKHYRLLFIITQFITGGMFVSFLLQGYGIFSITLSTLHLLITWWFAFHFIKDCSAAVRSTWSCTFALTAVRFLVFSSAGPLCLGAVMAIQGSGSNLYYGCIHFYLHFQHSGWFTFAVLALFFRHLENKGVLPDGHFTRLFYRALVITTFFTFLLSILWMNPPKIVYIFAALAVLFQAGAWIFFFQFVYRKNAEIKSAFRKPVTALLLISLSCLVLKIILQTLSAFPLLADIAHRFRNFTIGYLHLIFIGFVSFFLLGMFMQREELPINIRTHTGLLLLATGFAGSEIVLFGSALLPLLNIPEACLFIQPVFWLSAIMTGGVLILTVERVMRFHLTDKTLWTDELSALLKNKRI